MVEDVDERESHLSLLGSLGVRVRFGRVYGVTKGTT